MANEKNSKNRSSGKKAPQEKSGQPDFRIVSAKEKDGTNEVFWTRIGSAWHAKDGGISCSLNALPLGDRFMLFVNDEENEGNEK
jgi:hypothetical protein